MATEKMLEAKSDEIIEDLSHRLNMQKSFFVTKATHTEEIDKCLSKLKVHSTQFASTASDLSGFSKRIGQIEKNQQDFATKKEFFEVNEKMAGFIKREMIQHKILNQIVRSR